VKSFTGHLSKSNLSYFQHMFRAWGFAYDAFKIVAILKVHAILPFVWETRASELTRELHHKMMKVENE